MKYSKNQKLAKDFLKWLHQDANYEKWFQVNEGYSVGSTKKWEDHPMWAKVDKPLQVFRQAARQARMLGYPGPASAKATESYTKYIIVDMYAKAVQGTKAEDAVKWAEGELKKIYEASARVRCEEADRGGRGERRRPAGGAPAAPDVTALAPLTRMLENESLLAAVLLAPTVLLLGVFIAYPFVMGVWLSLVEHQRGQRRRSSWGWRTSPRRGTTRSSSTAFWNTCVYTFWATIFKLALGMWLALLLNRHFRGKRLVRASMLLPFIVPTVLSTFAWRWMFDPTFSVLNWLLYKARVHRHQAAVPRPTAPRRSGARSW